MFLGSIPLRTPTSSFHDTNIGAEFDTVRADIILSNPYNAEGDRLAQRCEQVGCRTGSLERPVVRGMGVFAGIYYNLLDDGRSFAPIRRITLDSFSECPAIMMIFHSMYEAGRLFSLADAVPSFKPFRISVHRWVEVRMLVRLFHAAKAFTPSIPIECPSECFLIQSGT